MLARSSVDERLVQLCGKGLFMVGVLPKLGLDDLMLRAQRELGLLVDVKTFMHRP